MGQIVTTRLLALLTQLRQLREREHAGVTDPTELAETRRRLWDEFDPSGCLRAAGRDRLREMIPGIDLTMREYEEMFE